MTPDRRTAANKVNAAKSTGPRTKEGKSIASKNAIKHGLTMPPRPEAVRNWLKVILNDDDADLQYMGHDDVRQATLGLAEAEARLERALAAESAIAADLAKYTMSHAEPDLFKLDIDDLNDPAVLAMMMKGDFDDFMLGALKILLAANSNTIPKLAKKLERIQRYVRQAERQKAKALLAWQTTTHEHKPQNEPKLQLQGA